MTELGVPASEATDRRPAALADSDALRAYVRDLASLLALPALWQSSEPADIVRDVGEVLVSLLRLDGVVVWLSPSGGEPLVSRVPADSSLAFLVETAERFATDASALPSEISHRFGTPDVQRVWVTRSGVATVGGVVVGLSSRASFPTDYEQFLLQATVDQAAVALQSAERLRQTRVALQARDTFFSVAAHELRTPMTGMLAGVQLLRRMSVRNEVVEPARLEKQLDMVEGQIQRLSRLTTQLLDVTRMETGKLSIEPQPTDLATLAGEVVRAASARAPAHQIEVTAPPGLEAVVDPLRLDQVLTNLVDNAIKYGPSGGRIALEIAQMDAATVEIRVDDEGPGIALEHRERIFERTFQVQPTKHARGLGLGLYICRQIAQAHGGHIWVENGPRGGARFVLRLPLCCEPLVSAAEEPTVETTRKPAA